MTEIVMQNSHHGNHEPALAARIEKTHLGNIDNKMKTDFVFQVVDLMTDTWLGDVKFRRGARNILLLCNGDEITEMAQFHAATVTNSYNESRICACGVITP
jgi:hypothetical protein